MVEGNVAVDPVPAGAPWHDWLDGYVEEMERLDDDEPLPDNFEDICKGRAVIPVYSRAVAS